MTFDDFFTKTTGLPAPFPYQTRLAESEDWPARIEIPAFKTRGQWRIKRAALDKWIDAQPRGGDGGRDGG